eukprot:1156720-Pelagomonas_calceolata.AAC.5
MEAEGTLPASIKEKETHWLRRAVSPLHHEAAKQKESFQLYHIAMPSKNSKRIMDVRKAIHWQNWTWEFFPFVFYLLSVSALTLSSR